jgi:hypothetical protein
MTIRENPAPRETTTGTPARATRSGASGRPATVGAAAGGAAAYGRPAASRPDPRPMRVALAAGGIAALSALLATISAAAIPAGASVITAQTDTPADAAIVSQVTRVVKLPPGVKAPQNAGPNVVVTQLPAPIAKPKTVVVTTTQSGKVVKP